LHPFPPAAAKLFLRGQDRLPEIDDFFGAANIYAGKRGQAIDALAFATFHLVASALEEPAELIATIVCGRCGPGEAADQEYAQDYICGRKASELHHATHRTRRYNSQLGQRRASLEAAVEYQSLAKKA
jgi:hypothetical protein